jgi:hypothetical protein
MQTLHQGDWKAVRQNLRPRQSAPQLRTELYHLGRDPAETEDLSEAETERVRRMERLMREQRRPSAEFPIPILDAPQSGA